MKELKKSKANVNRRIYIFNLLIYERKIRLRSFCLNLNINLSN